MGKKLLFFITLSFLFIFSNSFSFAEAEENITNEDNVSVQPYCLTCGGTYTENYKVTSTTTSYGSWQKVKTVYGGAKGGNITLSSSIAYTTSVSSNVGVNLEAINASTNFTVGRTETESVSQTFNTGANKKYNLMKRAVYSVKKVRYSVYTLSTGGRKEFLGYKYVDVKKLVDTELNLVNA